MLRGILMAVLVVLYTGNSFSQDKKIKSYELRGYVKDLQNVIFNYDPYDVTYSNLIHNRINFKWNISKSFYTRIEMRNRILYSEQAKSIPGYSKYLDVDDGYVKLGKLWVDESGWAVHSIFDRALLNYSTGKVSITAGRQRINWGVNTVWNPNDLFNAYNFLDFDYEERPGSDAVRVQYFMKTLSSLEVAVKPSKEENRSVAAILYKFNRWNYDFQFLTGVYYNDIALGTGWAGSIKNAGFKVRQPIS